MRHFLSALIWVILGAVSMAGIPGFADDAFAAKNNRPARTSSLPKPPPPPKPEPTPNTPEDRKTVCAQRLAKAAEARTLFNARCEPAFRGMTMRASCRKLCADKRNFETGLSCRVKCSSCMRYLRTINAAKSCLRRR